MKIKNIAEELLQHISGKAPVICVELRRVEWIWGDSETEDSMLEHKTAGPLTEDRLEEIKEWPDYNAWFGHQILFGTVWYRDGSWSVRREYDGNEWWEYLSCPEMPLQDM